jgi:restriction system protein
MPSNYGANTPLDCCLLLSARYSNISMCLQRQLDAQLHAQSFGSSLATHSHSVDNAATEMDITFHYPPDLFNLLVDTIPRLCRSKQDVFLFFRGAGIEQKYYVDLDKRVRADSSSITKFEIVRSVLTRLNATGEKALRERREVLKRVTQFEEFETCWDNDRLKAKGLVAEVRKLVDVKDSFTRMEQEKDRERLARQKQIEQKQKAEEDRRLELKSIRDEFFKLFGVTDYQMRGKLLEAAMNRLFKAHSVGLREAFTLRGDGGGGVVEQIDGVIELEGNVYLVEMKWWGEALGPGDVAQHLVRVYHRGYARGMFISNAGYTPAAIEMCRESLQRTVVVLSELREFVDVLEKEVSLREWLKQKIDAAITHKNPHHMPLS